MSRLVIDASVAIPWFVEEAATAAARRLRASGAALLAPGFLIAEFGGALLRNERQGRVPADFADGAIQELLISGGIAFSDTDALIGQALTLSKRLTHSVYDCLYLALCRREEAMLATFDRRLGTLATQLAIPLWEPDTA